MSNINNFFQLITLPKITDARGNLSFIEENKHIPFEIKRTYWLYDIPGKSKRGEGHAYRKANELIIPLSGSFKVEIIKDDQITIELKSPSQGLLINNLTWRRIFDFTTNAICLVLSSEAYSEDDYIYDWDLYNSLKITG